MNKNAQFQFNDSMPVTYDDALPDSVDVVVIGAGVIGISTAWYLLKKGCSVLVCDKGRVAAEQSSRNWGWVRVMGRDPAEVPIAMDSLRCWEDLAAELGDGLGFRRHGIVYFASSDKELAAYEQWVEVAKAHDLPTHMFGRDQVSRFISSDQTNMHGGMFTGSDARAEPFTAVPTIARGVHERGGIIKESCAVRGIDIEAGRVTGVFTEAGLVKTQRVVCAAGAWSSKLLGNCGITLPQLTVRSTVVRTAVAPEVVKGAAGVGNIFIRRREDKGYTLASGVTEHTLGLGSLRHGLRFLPSFNASSEARLRIGRDATQPSLFANTWDMDRPSPFEQHRVLNPEPSVSDVKRMRANLAQRVPRLAGVPFEQAWAGMIDAMPDVVPVIGEVESHDGLFVASGFSGHGFGIGPGAGKVIAQCLTGETPDHDLSRFRLSRFFDGSTLVPGPAI